MSKNEKIISIAIVLVVILSVLLGAQKDEIPNDAGADEEFEGASTACDWRGPHYGTDC
jgi:hypothetical protein